MKSKTKLLIVSGTVDFLQETVQAVKSGGYQLLEAGNASACLHLVEEQYPDVVMVVHPVSDMDTFQLCRQLKSIPEAKNSIIFLVSGNGFTTGEQARGLKAGVDGFLSKPLDRHKLMVELESRLRIRQRAEEVLKETEEKYHLLFTTSNEGIIILDIKGRIVDVNPRFLEMTGYEREEIVGIGPTACASLFKIDIKQIKNKLNGFLAGRISSSDWVLTTKSGETINIVVHPSFIQKDNKRIGISTIVRDITERKRAEDQISLASQEWSSTFDAISDGISLLDLEGVIVRCNKAVARLTGKPEAELIGKPCIELMRDGQEKIEGVCPFDVAKKTLKRESIQRPLNGKWFEVTVDPKLDEDNRPTGFVHIISDITERMHAEESLRISEDRLSKIMLAANDGMWDWDLSSNNVYFDPRYYEMAGYEVDAFPHKLEEFEKRVHPDDVDHVMDQARKHLQGDLERFIVEFRFKMKSGDWLWILGRGVIVERGEDGSPLRFVGTHRDISERKRAEEALRESETKYRSLIENSNDAIYLLYNRRFILINKKFEALMGVTLKEVYRDDFDFMSLIKPEDHSIIHKRMADMAEGKDISPNYQFTAIRPDGRELILEASVSYVPFKEGMATQGIIRDITERMKAEEKIKQSLEEKEVLLREIHHRVKNNLTVITSLLNLQANRIKTKKQAIDAFKESRDRVYAMAMVHERLYQSGNYSEINMQGYTESLAQTLLRVYNPSTNITFNFALDEINIDINRAIPCGLILSELITNALKHAFNGRKTGEITISFKKPAAGPYEILVKDNGIGLPDKTETGNTASIGLRLITILTEQLDGELSIASHGGAEFRIRFPVKNDEKSHRHHKR